MWKTLFFISFVWELAGKGQPKKGEDVKHWNSWEESVYRGNGVFHLTGSGAAHIYGSWYQRIPHKASCSWGHWIFSNSGDLPVCPPVWTCGFLTLLKFWQVFTQLAEWSYGFFGLGHIKSLSYGRGCYVTICPGTFVRLLARFILSRNN